MEIARAQLQRPGKGEDAYLVRPLDEFGSIQLIAVADGLSLNDGKAAANWVINCLAGMPNVDSPRTILEELRRELSLSQCKTQSETTLTCGILRQVDVEHNGFLRFEYFAVGDSPIWKVVKGDLRYPFQRLLVHGTPYPAETAKVYSTVRLQEGDIQGGVAFGAVEIGYGEVLVVCTDGIPEREIFIRDANNLESEGGMSLCRWLFQSPSYDNGKLGEVLTEYDKRGVLFDDATLITARLAPIPVSTGDACNAKPVDVRAEAAFMPNLLTDHASLNIEPTENLSSENEPSVIPPAAPSLSSLDESLGPKREQVGWEEGHSGKDPSAQQSVSTPPDDRNEAMPLEELLGSPQVSIESVQVGRVKSEITEQKARSEKPSAKQIEGQDASPTQPSSPNLLSVRRGRRHRRR